jgi:uncharacterized protein (TIGR04255 family)
MNRTLPPLKLSKSPLVLVLCQVRFTPILAMADYVPRIQDHLRKRGYPHVRSAPGQDVVFSPTGLQVAQQPRWILQDKPRVRSIILAQSFVAFETTAYGVFDDFIEDLALAVNTVAEAVQQLNVQRVGLRYVDLVRSPDGETWHEYIRSELHGVQSPVFRSSTQLQLHQSMAQTDHGTMVVRIFQNRDGQLLPPDLAETASTPMVTPPLTAGELLTLLDLDHYNDVGRDYESGAVEQQAWQLHDDLDRVFREAVVTPAALEAWR